MLNKALISLALIMDATLRFLLGTRNMSAGGLATGTTKSKIKSANTLTYMVDGVIYTKAATDDLFVHAAGSPTQAVGTTRYYLVSLDTAGTGGVITAGDANSLPPCPAGACPVGILKIVTDATHTFVPGTTLNDAAGITATIYDIGAGPATLP